MQRPENLAALATTIATGFAGVSRAGLESGEVVVHSTRDALLGLMTALRDDPRTLCQQAMDICGVDWPQRAERFEVVYNLLSVALNHRIRVIVTTDEATPVPRFPAFGHRPPGGNAKYGTCSVCASMAWRTTGVS